ncbi:response regulator [candidate division CSSED10-310 bacterium]|uniref:Response regulator n=1 Tax=candidate division CSSED10-310 bacterium TaxID=2855610 RepID=A0ABV6YTA9_UNCC1
MAQPKILLVDDNPIILEIEKSVLKVEDYTIETASDGSEALEKVKTFKPDLILLDIMMPQMDGYQVARCLKEDEETQAIPIVMVTAKRRPEDMNEGYLEGAAGYITKPFKSEELLKVVRILLSNKME